ncbi:MAG TPA: rhodanese-like domain-containing protein [Pyrinomonadaceae bacterium]|jgi:rhodanese-related sulfurtransferase
MRLINPKRIELCANIAIITLALLLGALAIRRHFFPPTPAPRPRGTLEPAALIGSHPTLPAVDWAKQGRTVLLALSTHCRYCTQSAPFYQRLAQTLARQADTKLLAVFPEESAEAQRYLQALGLSVAGVYQAPLANIGVGGTPTLLVVDDKGAVVKAWVGQLNDDDESEVWQALQLMDDRAQGQTNKPPSIDAAELRAALARHEQVLLVDVRPRADFARQHIPGALNIPLDELGIRAPNELQPSNKRVVVYADCGHCTDDGKGRAAQQIMAELGFRQVVMLREGLTGWTQAEARAARR